MSDGRLPLLLDTHYFVWLQLGLASRLGAPVRRAIEEAASKGELLISVITVWEVAVLQSKGRLELYSPIDDWMRSALAAPGLSVAPLTPEIAIESCRLPLPFHGDPADRIIVATARKTAARLLTSDRKLIQYGRRRHVALF